MYFDVHVHPAGLDFERNGNFLSEKILASLSFRLFRRVLGISNRQIANGEADGLLLQKYLEWLNGSSIDRSVFLAYDAVYRKDGTRDQESTHMLVGNDYIADAAEKNKKVLFGASVHPYRKDALTELERLIERGACLLKWLPPAQGMDPADPACFPIYEMLAHYKLPLLCHTGGEESVLVMDEKLKDPSRLIPALERGVTVIAAHCGAKSRPTERCHFDTWKEMALKYENLYGDTGAFGEPHKMYATRRLLREPELLNKVLYASDYPNPTFPLFYAPMIGFWRGLEYQVRLNPMEQGIKTFMALGFPDEVFTRAEKILRLSGDKKTP